MKEVLTERIDSPSERVDQPSDQRHERMNWAKSFRDSIERGLANYEDCFQADLTFLDFLKTYNGISTYQDSMANLAYELEHDDRLSAADKEEYAKFLEASRKRWQRIKDAFDRRLEESKEMELEQFAFWASPTHFGLINEMRYRKSDYPDQHPEDMLGNLAAHRRNLKIYGEENWYTPEQMAELEKRFDELEAHFQELLEKSQ